MSTDYTDSFRSKVNSPTNFVKGAKSQGKDINTVENNPTVQTVHKLAVSKYQPIS